MKQIISFTYEKATGARSQRVLSVAHEPSKFFAGTDISELEPVDQVLYAQAVATLKAEYLEGLHALNDEFDIKNNYRQFDPSRMTSVVEEEI